MAEPEVRGVCYGGESNVMIIGDYPTKGEVENGDAISDSVGGQVDRLLRPHGFRLENTYRTSLIKRTIPGAGSRVKKDRLKTIAAALDSKNWQGLLEDEIKTIKPNVIISLGELPLNILTGEKGIINYRGSILSLTKDFEVGCTPKVIPTFHPRQIWEDQRAMAYVSLDYRKALRFKDTPGPYSRNETIWVCRDINAGRNWWARARRGRFLTVDIETYAGFITCIGFCHDGKEAVSFPLWEGIEGVNQVLIWKLLAEILGSDVWFVNQNIGYDHFQCQDRWNFPIKKIWDDTMLLGHSLYPELPKKLSFYTSIYTDQPYYKDEGGEFDPSKHSFDQLFRYNAKDALTTWLVYDGMVKDAKSETVWPGRTIWDFHRERVWPLYFTYRKINERGIRVDLAKRDSLVTKYESVRDEHQTALDKFCGREINVNSNKQMGTLVYEEMGFKKRTHVTDAGVVALDTDKETLEDICINECDPGSSERLVLRRAILVRKCHTILTHLKKAIHRDGRLRTSYKIHGTKAGRTSGTNHHDFNLSYLLKTRKLVYEYLGASLQTIPKRPFEAEEFEGQVFGADIPEMFVPSPGFVFVEGDGGAAEARVVAVLADDWETLAFMDKKEFKRNQHGIKDDVHTFTAMNCMQMLFEDITEYIRDTFGKRPRHAGNYDMGAFRLSLMIHQAIAQCEIVLNNFHAHSPKIREVFHETIRQLLWECQPLVTPHGRRREFFNRRSKEFFKEAFSFIPQGTVSDHTKSCIDPIWEAHPDAFCLVEKHDSTLWEVPEGDEIPFAYTFKEQMERPIDFRHGSIIRDFELVIPAEIKVGLPEGHWNSLKELKLAA